MEEREFMEIIIIKEMSLTDCIFCIYNIVYYYIINNKQ